MSTRERIDELLVLRAIEGLTPAQEHELGRLLEDEPSVDAARFDAAAALVTLAMLDLREDIPASLARSLLSRARSSRARSSRD